VINFKGPEVLTKRQVVVKGHCDWNFRLKDKLLRYEISVVLNRAFNLDKTGNENYVDAPKSHWMYDFSFIHSLVK